MSDLFGNHIVGFSTRLRMCLPEVRGTLVSMTFSLTCKYVCKSGNKCFVRFEPPVVFSAVICTPAFCGLRGKYVGGISLFNKKLYNTVNMKSQGIIVVKVHFKMHYSLGYFFTDMLILVGEKFALNNI